MAEKGDNKVDDERIGDVRSEDSGLATARNSRARPTTKHSKNGVGHGGVPAHGQDGSPGENHMVHDDFSCERRNNTAEDSDLASGRKTPSPSKATPSPNRNESVRRGGNDYSPGDTQSGTKGGLDDTKEPTRKGRAGRGLGKAAKQKWKPKSSSDPTVDSAIRGMQQAQGEADAYKDIMDDLKEQMKEEEAQQIDTSKGVLVQRDIPDSFDLTYVPPTIPEPPLDIKITAYRGLKEECLLYYMKHGDSDKARAGLLAAIEVRMRNNKFYEAFPEYTEPLKQILNEVFIEATRPEDIITYRSRVSRWIYKNWNFVTKLKIASVATVIFGISLIGICYKKHISLKKTCTIGLLGVSSICGLVSLLGQKRTYANKIKVKGLMSQCAPLLQDTKHSGTIKRPHNPKPCTHRIYPVGFSVNLDSCFIPDSGCEPTEYRGVVTRQCILEISTPEVRKNMWSDAFKYLKMHISFPPVNIDNLSPEEMRQAWLNHYPMKSRDLLSRTHDALAVDENINFKRKGFVKVEVTCGKSAGKTDPRIINAAYTEHLVTLGPGYYNYQKNLTKHRFANWQMAIESRAIYTGAMNPTDIGSLVMYMWMRGYKVSEGDFSRYDGHTESEAINAENDFMEEFVDSSCMRCLRQLTDTNCRMSTGITFKRHGGFVSGNPNTSLGNSLRVLAMFCKIMHLLSIDDFYVAVCGDDNLIFTKVTMDVPKVVEYCEDFGHKLVMIERGYDFDRVEYCSGYLWHTTPWVLCSKLGKILTKGFVIVHLQEDIGLLRHVAAICRGYRHYRFLPILGEIISQFEKLKLPDTKVIINEYTTRLEHEVEWDQMEIDMQFASIYGIDAQSARDVASNIDWTEMGCWHKHEIFDQICRVDGVKSESPATLYNRGIIFE